MKFAILGAGAVGGYFGARLAEAGEDVSFMARNAHLEAIRSTGLRIESENGDAHIHPAQVSDDPAEVGPVDYVLFAVKLFQTEETAGFAKPLVGPNT
ncbi:MAG: 2-dehydropantoate 2-reductase N-terminal domain-containing protein, partial [Pseudomonadota bacterium]|nr:2-dehydropantoate 2-reductase N-terminal domain-containing protein [Pseudomonadota bacterium]